MIKSLKLLPLALSSILIGNVAFAKDEVNAKANENVKVVKAEEVKKQNKEELNEIIKNLQSQNPEMPKIKELTETNIPNLYEVLLDTNEIFYSDKKGEYLLFGDFYENKNGKKVNLKEEKIDKLTAFKFKDLNYKNAITTKKGNGKNVIVTFEDPNCGFCKKLHPELEKLTNVTIHTFLIPILGPKSIEATNNIWCSKSKADAFNKYMKDGTLPQVDEKQLNSCNKDAITQNLEFAKKYNIRGTPAIFFDNGNKLKGYAPFDVIKEKMEKSK